MNKYNLTWQAHYKLKCLNQNIIDERIIITTTRFNNFTDKNFHRYLHLQFIGKYLKCLNKNLSRQKKNSN
jgi:predicted nucleic-acid-binding Zn-ribbon protein